MLIRAWEPQLFNRYVCLAFSWFFFPLSVMPSLVVWAARRDKLVCEHPIMCIETHPSIQKPDNPSVNSCVQTRAAWPWILHQRCCRLRWWGLWNLLPIWIGEKKRKDKDGSGSHELWCCLKDLYHLKDEKNQPPKRNCPQDWFLHRFWLIGGKYRDGFCLPSTARGPKVEFFSSFFFFFCTMLRVRWDFLVLHEAAKEQGSNMKSKALGGLKWILIWGLQSCWASAETRSSSEMELGAIALITVNLSLAEKHYRISQKREFVAAVL